MLRLERICLIEAYVPAGKHLRFPLPDDTSSYIQAFFSHLGYHYLLVPAALAIAPESLAASFPPQPRAWRKDWTSFCFSSCQEQPQFWEGQFHRGLSSSITLLPGTTSIRAPYSLTQFVNHHGFVLILAATAIDAATPPLTGIQEVLKSFQLLRIVEEGHFRCDAGRSHWILRSSYFYPKLLIFFTRLNIFKYF